MTRWLDDDEMRAWRGMVDVYASVAASLEADLLDQHGLSHGEYAVLVALSEAEGGHLRMCDLAEALHLSPSGLTRRLDGLVRRDLVCRETSPTDRRVILAAMTPAGRRALEDAAPDHVESVRRHFLDHLSRDQIRGLGAAFAAVQEGRLGGGREPSDPSASEPPAVA